VVQRRRTSLADIIRPEARLYQLHNRHYHALSSEQIGDSVGIVSSRNGRRSPNGSKAGDREQTKDAMSGAYPTPYLIRSRSNRVA
jgi:hypothetical protein